MALEHIAAAPGLGSVNRGPESAGFRGVVACDTGHDLLELPALHRHLSA
jgi:hypothetical protein